MPGDFDVRSWLTQGVQLPTFKRTSPLLKAPRPAPGKLESPYPSTICPIDLS